MGIQTIIYIVIAVVVALLLALFQYRQTTKSTTLKLVLFALRFTTIFSILILLINPKFEATKVFEEKPNLVIAIDNSESVDYLNQNEKALDIYNKITANTDIQNRFNVLSYSFGTSFKALDSLTFDERQSDISKVFKNYKELFESSISPLVLISDGNQTLGSDYLYSNVKENHSIFPVILGDTVTYSDIKLQHVNVNRYAFLKNRFPIEIIANYAGNNPVKSQVRILSGNTVVFSKLIEFNATKTSQIITTTLGANTVGIKTYRVELMPLVNEKNTVNNSKNFAIEVIDQKTNVAIVSNTLHPDLGALKKSIEANEQRKVTLLKTNEITSKVNDFQLVILYQPNNNFSELFSILSKEKINTFIITGSITDWRFVNANQDFFTQEITNQYENYQPTLNTNYSIFTIDNITFNDYPPLNSNFGTLSFNVPSETILYKTINGISTETPLLSTFEVNGQKHALLNGDGIWRWRAQTFLDTDNFENFDNFIGKLVQYLSSNKKRNRINIDYKSFYRGNDNITITAQYFNKNYEFDANANLQIELKNTSDNSTTLLPLLLKNSSYVTNISGIAAGDYTFTVKNLDEPVSASGKFKVLDYNVEQQFLNANVAKLQSVASKSNGQAFFIDKADALIDTLLNDSRFSTIQKSIKSTIPLIDWKYLLGLIALALSLEWFIRKYNGLI